MKSASVADLRNNFATVSQWLQEGESITITKRGRAFATLSPVRRRKGVTPSVDSMARLLKIFPAGPAAGDVRDALDEDRGNT